MLTPEVLDMHVLPRVSLLFVLIFFVPLAVMVLVPTLFVTRNLRKWGWGISWLWLAACLPAEGLMLMGYAFNSMASAVFITMAIWPFLGLALIWLPVGLKMAVYR